MTNPTTIAQKVVDDIKANAAALAAVGTGMTAADVLLHDETVRGTFLETLQKLEAPGVLVVDEATGPGPGGGVWWVHRVGIYLRLGEGGSSAVFLQELVGDPEDLLGWQYQCLIEGQTDQPEFVSRQRLNFGIDVDVPVLTFTVGDRTK